MNSLQKRLDFFVNAISKGLAAASAAAILLITLIITADASMRYLCNSPLLWSGEICEFLLSLIVFGGFAYTFQQGGHIRIELVTQNLPPKIRYWMRVATLCIAVLYLIVFTWQILLFVKESYSFHRS